MRYSFDIYNGAVRRLQQDDYYAFGLRKSVSPVALDNKYLYNGKELQDELGQYDYGARFYDPVIGRWNVVDPLADHSFDLTSYHFCSNNPINRLDPDGRCDKPNCPHGGPLRTEDRTSDHIGFIRNSTADGRANTPIKAAILDFSFSILDVLGFNTIDNAISKEGNLTTAEKVDAGLAVLSIIDPPIGGRGKAKVSNGPKIKVEPEFKIDRDLLDPPKSFGNAPTFKKDGKSVEIHHVGQQASGPFWEMHPSEHRMGTNYRTNHPQGQKPLTKAERKQFVKMKSEYWNNEYKFK